jgi:hypothetical protein
VPEVLYLILQELTLLRIEFYTGFSEPLKHVPQVEQVLLQSVANMITSKYTRYESYVRPHRTVSISLSNVAKRSEAKEHDCKRP